MPEPHHRLRLARERAGFATAKSAAEAMGVPVATYIQHENGSRGFPAGRAARYARFFRVTPEWLLYGRGEPNIAPAPMPVNRSVPVLGAVQAGVWTEIMDQAPEPEAFVPLVMPGFEGAQLYALRVVGESMNLYYPDGALVIVCPAAEIGVRDGDHVVVKRQRGGLEETTIKEVKARRGGGVTLHPRSSDPAHQAPIHIPEDPDAQEGVAIVGVVVASYNIRPQARKPLLRL